MSDLDDAALVLARSRPGRPASLLSHVSFQDGPNFGHDILGRPVEGFFDGQESFGTIEGDRVGVDGGLLLLG